MYHGEQFVLGDGGAVPIPIIKGVDGAQKCIHLPDGTGISGVGVDEKLGVVVDDGVPLTVGLESATTGGSGLHVHYQIDGTAVAFISGEIQEAGIGGNPLEEGDGVIFGDPGGQTVGRKAIRLHGIG